MAATKTELLLVIDDDVYVRTSICMYFEDLGYEVMEADNGIDGLRLASQKHPSMVFCDLRMPGMDGLEVLKEMTSTLPEIPIAVISGAGRIQDVVEALRRGAWNYVTKPVEDMAVLRHVAEQAIEKARLQRENLSHHAYLEEEVVRRTRQLAKSTARAKILAEEANAASHAKGEFLANMSHELRTPLNSIMVLSRVLAENREKNLKGNQIEMLEQISSSGHELLGLVNEVLEVSKFESSEIRLEMKMISVQKFVHRIDRIISPLAWQKGLSYVIEVADDAPKTFFSDVLKAMRIVRNLINNAVKFTAKGNITIRIGKPPPEMDLGAIKFSHDNALMVQIADTGIGIDADEQKQIFSMFTQADGADTRKFQGSGLGLTISSRFATALGGDIFLESEPGLGSTFSVVFPAHTDVDSREVRVISKSPGVPYAVESVRDVGSDNGMFNGEKVLVANNDMRVVFNMSAMMETLGAEVLIASSSVSVVQHLNESTVLDLVIAKGNLLNREACNILRALRDKAPPVIIVLDEQQHGTLASHCAIKATVVEHPLTYDKLIPVIKRVLW